MSASISQYRAQVETYLKDGYGATDLSLEPGGKHHKLRFNINGTDRFIILNDRNARGGKAVDIKLQDIRRLLGDPSYPHRHQHQLFNGKRTLKQMTDELNALVPIPETPATSAVAPVFVLPDLKGKLSNIKGRYDLVIPEDAYRVFDHVSCAMMVRGRGHDTWEVSPLPKDSTRFPRFKFSAFAGGYILGSNTKDLFADLPTFGRSPVRLTVRRHSILIALDRAKLKARINRGQRPPEISSDAEIKAVTTQVQVVPETIIHHFNLRQLLIDLRAIETTSEYRLRRVKAPDGTERWEFRAPAITLDEGDAL